MSANAARIDLTPAEIEERKALFRRLNREFGKGAEVIPPSATILDHPSRGRKPLGLRPIAEDNNGDGDGDKYLGPQATAEKIVAGSLAMLSAEQRSATASMEALWVYGIGYSLETSFENGEDLRKRTKELRGEIAELKAAQRLETVELKSVVAELKAEVSALRSIQEGQRIQSRGEAGVAGPRGVAGSQGPVGPAGLQGPRGDAAALIVSWETRPDRFELVPILGDGTRGVGAHLLPFFEQYDATIRDDGDGEE